MLARLSDGGVVENCRLAFGGVGAHVVLANRTQDKLIGRYIAYLFAGSILVTALST